MSSFAPDSEAFAADPWSVYAGLRAAGAPVYDPATDAWLLSSWLQVDEAARDPRLKRGTDSFLSASEQARLRQRAGRDGMPNHERFVQFSLLEIDGPRHQQLRQLLLGELGRARMRVHGPAIEQQAWMLVRDALDRGSLNFVDAFAARVPGCVIGELLGIPASDRDQLRRWSDDIVQFFDVNRTSAHKALAERATTEFAEYVRALLQARRWAGGDDLLTHLAKLGQDGTLSEQEAISTTMLVLMAGHGSTIDALGNSLHALLQFPEEIRTLRDQPECWPRAVDELLRFDPPLPYFHRFAGEPLQIGNQTFAPGTRFGLLYGSANRDAVAFPDPDRLDVRRKPNRHLSFGRGAHLCLGNHLARLSIAIVLRLWLEQVEVVGIGNTRFRCGLAARGLDLFELDVRPRSRSGDQ